jgi:hypothetical protein
MAWHHGLASLAITIFVAYSGWVVSLQFFLIKKKKYFGHFDKI